MLQRCVIVCLMAVLFVSCARVPNPFDETKGDPRLEDPLYDRGYDLLSGDDWREHWTIMGDPAGWSYADGVIRSEGGKGGDWLCSNKTYSDFVLKLQYRISPGGNSGVFIRADREGKPWLTGMECQISNEQPPRDPMHCTGSLYGYVPADPRPNEEPNVWHDYTILCKKQRVIVQVDTVKTVDVDLSDIEAVQEKPLQGFIGLQDAHSPEGYWVEFRNVVIRDLTRKPE